MLEKALLTEPSETLTYHEFLATDFENPHVEWVDGRVVEMAPISDAHSDVGGFLEALIRLYAEEKKLGIVRHDPFQMKTGFGLPGRAPDILFVSNAHKKRIKKTYLDGPADLVVEIISPESIGRDRGEKFYEYEKGGVPEYWLIDPQRKQAEFYLLDKSGLYHPSRLDADGVFHSKMLPRLWINPDWFWKSPLLPVLSVLRQWKLI